MSQEQSSASNPADPFRVLNFENLEIVRSELKEGPVLFRHESYCWASDFRILVFRTYDEMGKYFRSNAKPGDTMRFWGFTNCCTPDDGFLQGEFVELVALPIPEVSPPPDDGYTFHYPDRVSIDKHGVMFVPAGGYAPGTGIWDGYIKFKPDHPDYPFWQWLIKYWPYKSTLTHDDLPLLKEIFKRQASGHDTVPGELLLPPPKPVDPEPTVEHKPPLIVAGSVGLLNASHFETIGNAFAYSPVILEHISKDKPEPSDVHVFQGYYFLEKHLRAKAQAGDRLKFWSFAQACREDNCFLLAKYPDADGKVPPEFDPESESVDFAIYNIRRSEFQPDGSLRVPAYGSFRRSHWDKPLLIRPDRADYAFWKWLLTRWPYSSNLDGEDLPLLKAEFATKFPASSS